MENKLIASAEGKNAARFKFVYAILFVVFSFAVMPPALEAMRLEMLAEGIGLDELELLFVVFPIIVNILSISSFVLVLIDYILKKGKTSLYAYQDHIMAKWVSAKQPTKVEYSQILHIEAVNKTTLSITLGPPYNKAVVFRVDDRDAHQVCLDILSSQKISLTN